MLNLFFPDFVVYTAHTPFNSTCCRLVQQHVVQVYSKYTTCSEFDVDQSTIYKSKVTEFGLIAISIKNIFITSIKLF